VNFDNSARVSALLGNIRRGDSSAFDRRREVVSIFSKIKDAIFGHKSAPAQAHPAPTPQPAGAATGQAGTQAPPQAQAPTQQVDVEEVLSQISREKGNPDLNYKTSIVDLMKLLGMDSSLENRKELATELGYQGAKDGSAEMNIWLHKEVMRQLAAHGGKVPANLTD
jgi:3-oxoacyl-ACP reductase-like protein